MINHANPIKDLKDGTRVRVTFEGTVRDNYVETDDRAVSVYTNLLGRASVEVIKSPIGVGEFFIMDDPSDTGRGIWFAASPDTYVVISGAGRGVTSQYTIANLHKNGYKAITQEEVTKLLAPEVAKTSTNEDW